GAGRLGLRRRYGRGLVHRQRRARHAAVVARARAAARDERRDCELQGPDPRGAADRQLPPPLQDSVADAMSDIEQTPPTFLLVEDLEEGGLENWFLRNEVAFFLSRTALQLHALPTQLIENATAAVLGLSHSRDT